jgi:cell division protein FtsQ
MSLWGRLLSVILTVGTLIMGVFALVLWSENPAHFPLRAIEIQGNLQFLSATEVEKAVSGHMKRGFFWMDINAVQKAIQALPWVSTAEVKRQWPDRITIKLKEQVPQAIWNEQAILSTEGCIFYPELKTLPDRLPHFNGPEYRAREMLQQYFSFLEILSPLALSIAELNIAPDGTWRIMLDNGIAIILGKAAINERLSRFVLVYPGNLQAQRHKITYLDLRYTNGLAVGWKAVVQ